MIEYPDVDERKEALGKLMGFEQAVWMQVGDYQRVRPIANEDLDRTTAEKKKKTSAVAFPAFFELTPDMVAAAKAGAAIKAGVDHPNYATELTLPQATRDSLAQDLK